MCAGAVFVTDTVSMRAECLYSVLVVERGRMVEGKELVSASAKTVKGSTRCIQRDNRTSSFRRACSIRGGVCLVCVFGVRPFQRHAHRFAEDVVSLAPLPHSSCTISCNLHHTSAPVIRC